jgi:outer membrane receptor protein involved in Fe transport
MEVSMLSRKWFSRGVFLAAWMTALLGHLLAESLPGLVRSREGQPIASARVIALSPAGVPLAETRSDSLGAFVFDGLGQGGFWVRVEAPGFESQNQWLTSVPSRAIEPSSCTVIELRPAVLRTSITVSASRARVEDSSESAQFLTARSQEEFQSRPLATLGHAVEGAGGVTMQQTTAGQSSPFLRGLTGYHTLLLVDGIRLNTAIFRSGPNQYAAYLDASQAGVVEVMQGPASSQYGSDALGGVLHILTKPPSPSDRAHRRPRIEWSELADGADLSLRQQAQASGGTPRFSWLAGGSHTRHSRLRTGQGMDSHHVFTRYLGLTGAQVRSLTGERLQDSAFTQTGAEGRLLWRPTEHASLTASYLRGELFGVRSYRDLMGGLGRLQSASEPQTLDLLYLRHERRQAFGLDSLTATVSWNRQVDDSRRQGALVSDLITTDRNRVNALGYTAQAIRHLRGQAIVVGGVEHYLEEIASSREEILPSVLAAGGSPVARRAQYPNGSRYGNLGWFAHTDWDAPASPWRLSGGVRATWVRFRTFANQNLSPVGEPFGIRDESLLFTNTSYHVAATWRIRRNLALHGIRSTGFRAPNANDLGTLGLTGLGYELPFQDALALGALAGRDASESALPATARIGALRPESLRNTEAGVRWQAGRWVLRVQAFHAQFRDPIVRRTILFPLSALPATVAGLSVFPVPPTAAQRAAGVGMVATAEDPRGLKAFVNDGASRYLGGEARVQWQTPGGWFLDAAWNLLAARELNPNRYVRRLPPGQWATALRYAPRHGRWWTEFSLLGNRPQSELNAGDFDDERIGASRRRRDIATFFRSGVMQGWVAAGPDGLAGNADDVFRPTGETLAQIQDRVLPLGSVQQGLLVVDDNTRVPLYRETPGWVRLDLRGGLRVTPRWTLHYGCQNLLDRNYRVHGSGIDGAGRSLYLSVRAAF